MLETISRRSARPGPDAPQRRRAGGGTGRGERRGRREDAAPADARSGPMPRRPLHPCRPHPRPPPTARPGLERPQRGPERCPLGARETLSAALKAAAAPRRAWPGAFTKKPESSGISVSSGLSHCYRGSGFSKALQEDDDLDFPLPDIRLEEGTMEDEELTNLNWLHESKNLLKSFGESVLRSVSPVQDLDDDTPPSPAHSDMPYDARQNPNCKPPYSFSCLIFMAIEDSPTKRLPVKDIYNWILEHFPYFANAPTGWKNSVRHNLSLNKCFKKVDKERSQ
ncbi:hypothetical protein U0070_000396, partial [Myodes glareolus]